MKEITRYYYSKSSCITAFLQKWRETCLHLPQDGNLEFYETEISVNNTYHVVETYRKKVQDSSYIGLDLFDPSLYCLDPASLYYIEIYNIDALHNIQKLIGPLTHVSAFKPTR